jgi:hypothetical protein
MKFSNAANAVVAEVFGHRSFVVLVGKAPVLWRFEKAASLKGFVCIFPEKGCAWCRKTSASRLAVEHGKVIAACHKIDQAGFRPSTCRRLTGVTGKSPGH